MKQLFISSFFLIFLFCSCSYQPVKMTPSSFSVTKKSKKEKLTLLIYMASDNDLEKYALANLKQLERAETEGINVLVLMDRSEGNDETEGNWTDTRLFEVIYDSGSGSSIKSRRLNCPELGLSAASETELDMANPEVLKKFIEFGKTSYEAEKYALIIWGHGSGWKAFAIDERSDSYMTVRELAQAVRGQDLCVIGFDTCFGGVIENIYELKDCADYTVAAPGVTPGGGWNYKKLLESLSQEDFSAENIAAGMSISSSEEAPAEIFVNQKLKGLFEAFENFSKALAQTINDDDSRNAVFSSLNAIKSYSYKSSPCDIYLDIYSLAAFYESDSSPEIAGAAATLKQAVEAAVLESGSVNAAGVVIPGSYGIGVHFIPRSQSGALAASHSVDYIKDAGRTDQNAFIKESLWWVPSKGGASGSLLDKLFYTSFD